jgi:hypothetical protein
MTLYATEKSLVERELMIARGIRIRPVEGAVLGGQEIEAYYCQGVSVLVTLTENEQREQIDFEFLAVVG